MPSKIELEEEAMESLPKIGNVMDWILGDEVISSIGDNIPPKNFTQNNETIIVSATQANDVAEVPTSPIVTVHNNNTTISTPPQNLLLHTDIKNPMINTDKVALYNELLINSRVKYLAQPLLNDNFNLNSNDYPVKKGGTSDPFLIEFIDDNCNEKLLKLGMDFQVCLYHRCNKPDVEIDPRLVSIIQFFSNQFSSPEDKSKIEECIYSSTTVSIYGQNSSAQEVIIASINFAIIKDGIYVNWLATSHTLYTKISFCSGDDYALIKEE